MTFSDEDLKRLKEAIKNGDNISFVMSLVKRLLARLEAAEDVCAVTSHTHPEWETLRIWRKAKGDK